MTKLFVYGSLGPGGPNEYLLKRIGGSWATGFVMGKLYQEGWGATMGYPGIRLDDKVEKIAGHIFTSHNLEAYWSQLDAFEGEAYQRVKTTVFPEDQIGEVPAFIYVLR